MTYRYLSLGLEKNALGRWVREVVLLWTELNTDAIYVERARPSLMW